ncbi:MAG: tRNA 2-thiouridine(34) synthase MnmA, partial [Actinobacteria bacterium]|nr:tRNA 2-thiouridine(34) synthase MnmA [Actinomycetota bacterium]
RSLDPLKDQSYVLAVMGRERLSRALFPLGDVASKSEVRAEAAARGLRISAKPDSYDICFVADGDTKGFLRERLGAAPGPIVDVTGAEVGEHDGAYAYTVGQRKGLGLTRPAPDGAPRYVLEVRPATNTVVVGPAALLSVDVIEGEDTVWLADDVPAVTSVPATVQVRAHGEPMPALVRRAGSVLHVDLDAPTRGLAAGQSAVVYDGSRVLGQATIRAASRRRAA